MKIKIFMTGTDTSVGKTYASVALLKKFNAIGRRTVGLKPIASGCQESNGKFYSDDALALQGASSVKRDYDCVNAFAFAKPIAPHLAARAANTVLEKHKILEKINEALETPADVFVVEGAGGWLVPINDYELSSDMVKALNIPVILVVAIKLGCLNHALLTVRAIHQEKIPLLGWIANCTDPTVEVVSENIATLKNWIPSPCLGTLPYGNCPENFITIDPIIAYFSKVASPEENAL